MISGLVGSVGGHEHLDGAGNHPVQLLFGHRTVDFSEQPQLEEGAGGKLYILSGSQLDVIHFQVAERDMVLDEILKHGADIVGCCDGY